MSTQNYKRLTLPFLFQGIKLNAPVDLLPHGKYAIAQNIRSYLEGRIETRPGLTAVSASAHGADALVHSIRRLNDDSSGSNAWTRIRGAGIGLYDGQTAPTVR